MFTALPTTITSSEFRASLAQSLQKSKTAPLVITSDRGAESFVVLGAELYNYLVNEAELSADTHTLNHLVQQESESPKTSWASLRQ